MNFQLDVINIFILFVMLVNSIYGLVIYSRNRNDKVNFSFFLLTITISLWGITMFGYRGFSDHDLILLMARLLYFTATMIPTAFIYFVIFFPNSKIKITKIQKYLIPLPMIFLCILSLSTGRFAFIYDVIPRMDQETFIVFNVFVHILFGVYVVSYFSWAYWIIFKKYINANGSLRAQLGFIFIGTLGSTMTTLVTNMGLLYFGYFALNWVGQISIIFMITLIFYSILKFKLFNIKVITTEVLIFTLWVFILIKFFLSNNLQDQIINAVLLLLLIVVGIFLIRSVIKEVSQRERIELLATDLQKANDRLTELDRQKSEFVSFATHQLRAPLTAMKGYASLLLEGDMGKLPDEARQGVDRIYESTKTLTSIVDDYLNVSRIELGTMKYAFETIDLRMLIEDTIAELKPNIDKSGLKFAFTADQSTNGGGTDYRITADRDKLKQVIANVIDNSMKYTTKGSITATLSLDKEHHKFIFAVKDTGVGIAPETLPRLFQKFSRADNANKVNIRGTGLGLFVAKQMVEAHHGTIRAESAGEGKGSTFIVELEPLAKA